MLTGACDSGCVEALGERDIGKGNMGFGVEKYSGMCGECIAVWRGGERTVPVDEVYNCACGTEFVGAQGDILQRVRVLQTISHQYTWEGTQHTQGSTWLLHWLLALSI